MELVSFLAGAGITTDCASIDIPNGVYNLVHTIILLIQIAVPILLIIWGMLDFAKSVIGGDEDKIKAGQKIFIKRVIAAIIVFLVVTIVTLVVNAVGTLGVQDDAEKTNITTCMSNMIKGVK